MKKIMQAGRSRVFTVESDVLFSGMDFDACLKTIPEVRQREVLAAKFHKDRCQRLAGTILTGYALRECGYASSLTDISRTELGRPFIPSLICDFNLTHTSGLAAVAISLSRVGLDAEKIKIIPDLLDLAQKNFTYDEYQYLKQLSGNLQLDFFYRLWTLKESLLKAVGNGFTIPPNAFSVVNDDDILSEIAFHGRAWYFYPLPEIAGCKMTLCSDCRTEAEITNLAPMQLHAYIKKLR